MSAKVLVLCISALMLPSSASAQAGGMVCTISDRSNSYYLAPEITLSFHDYGEVSVRDSIVAEAGKKVVVGNVVRETAEKLSMSWEVRNIPADPREFRTSKPKLRIRLDIQKADGGATITASDLVHSNFVYRGSGVCRHDG